MNCHKKKNYVTTWYITDLIETVSAVLNIGQKMLLDSTESKMSRVVEIGAACIRAMSPSGTAHSNIDFGKHGAIPVIISALEVHGKTNASVAEAGCGALRNLAHNNDANITTIVSSGGIPLIFRLLEAHGETNASVAEAGCGALWILTHNNATNKTTTGASGGIPLILRLLEVHGDTSVTVQAKARGALKILEKCLKNSAALRLQRFLTRILTRKRRMRKLRHTLLTEQRHRIMQCLVPPPTQPRSCTVGATVVVRNRAQQEGLVVKYDGGTTARVQMLSGERAKNIDVSDLVLLPTGVKDISSALAVPFEDLVNNDNDVLDRCEASLASSTRVLKRRAKMLRVLMLELVETWSDKMPGSDCFETVFEEQAKQLANKLSGLASAPQNPSYAFEEEALLAINQRGGGFCQETFERRIEFWVEQWREPPKSPCAICCDYFLNQEYFTLMPLAATDTPSYLVGKRVRVEWGSGESYPGIFESVDDKGKLVVLYDDGDKKSYALRTSDDGQITAFNNEKQQCDVHKFFVASTAQEPSAKQQLPEVHGVSGCTTGSSVCKSCLREYCRVTMTEGVQPLWNSIPCFCRSSVCSTVIPDHAVKALFSSDPVLAREHTELERKLRHRRISAHPSLRFCPNSECKKIRTHNRVLNANFRGEQLPPPDPKGLLETLYFRCIEKIGVCCRNSPHIEDRDDGTVSYNERIAAYWRKHDNAGETESITHGTTRCCNPEFIMPERVLNVKRSSKASTDKASDKASDEASDEPSNDATRILSVSNLPSIDPSSMRALGPWSVLPLREGSRVYRQSQTKDEQDKESEGDYRPYFDGHIVASCTFVAESTTENDKAVVVTAASSSSLSSLYSSSSSLLSLSSSVALPSSVDKLYAFQSSVKSDPLMFLTEKEMFMSMYCSEQQLEAITVKWREQPYLNITAEAPSVLDLDDLTSLVSAYDRRSTRPEHFAEICKALKNPHRPSVLDLKRTEGGEVQETYTEEENSFKHGNKLRHYQLSGVNWMLWNWKNQRNSILADEMGLGKTVQSVMFANHLFEHVPISTKKNIKSTRRVGQFLIVAPLSVIPHWKREFDAWTEMNAIVYHGNAESRKLIERYETSYDEWDEIPTTSKGKKKTKRNMDVCKFDVVITTYEMCHMDAEFFQSIPWRLLVVDEAHKLKNAESQLCLMLRTINRNATLLLTGTPFQNDTKDPWKDLWSLLNFLDEKSFPKLQDFLDDCGEVSDAEGLSKLHGILGPYMLRRMKEDVERGIHSTVKSDKVVGEWLVVAESDKFGRCGKYLPMTKRKEGVGELFEQISKQEFFSPRLVVDGVAVVDLKVGTACWRCDARLCPKCGSTAHDDDESKRGEGCAAMHDFRLLGMVSSKANWVRCPKCQHVLERTKGCDHMTCRCGAQFCFVCGAMPHCGSKCNKK